MMATDSPVFLARAAPRLEMRVVLPLFPLGLKKDTTSEWWAAAEFPRFWMVSRSSSPVKGLIMNPPAPERIRRDWASESHFRLMPTMAVWG